MRKIEVLKVARDQRISEIEDYQINIDNYKLAIIKIDDPDLNGFRDHLQELLRSSILEQKKAKIMLSVVEDQLKEAE